MGTLQDGMEEAPHVVSQVEGVGVAPQGSRVGEECLGVRGLHGAASLATQKVDHVKGEVVTQSVPHPHPLL